MPSQAQSLTAFLMAAASIWTYHPHGVSYGGSDTDGWGKEAFYLLESIPSSALKKPEKSARKPRNSWLTVLTPQNTRRLKKAAERENAVNTLERIAREWHSNRLETWQPSTAQDILNRLEKDIFPGIGKLPVSSITHKQLIDTLRKIESRGAHEIAKRLKANCARIFSFAIQHGFTDRNIANDLTDVLKPVNYYHECCFHLRHLRSHYCS